PRRTVAIGREVTEALLTRLPAAFHANTADALLAALLLAVTERRRALPGRGPATPATGLSVQVEGHGREDTVEPGTDLSRTVGWFTTVHPVRLDAGRTDLAAARSGGPEIGRVLKTVKEQLRAAGQGGLGYGVLRHLNPQTAPGLAALPAPEISFNYLGRFGEGDGRTPWEPVAGGDALFHRTDPALPLAHALEIDVHAAPGPEGPRLHAVWSWAGEALDAEQVHLLADGWLTWLAALAAHGEHPDAGGRTPSDLDLIPLSQDEIDDFETDWNLA
ncbi:condensation domain-containing protein, partial [Kitasatospora sp. NPDC001574]